MHKDNELITVKLDFIEINQAILNIESGMRMHHDPLIEVGIKHLKKELDRAVLDGKKTF